RHNTAECTHAALRSTIYRIALDPHVHGSKQGAGRLDTTAAATATFSVSPTNLSLGRAIPGSEWARAETLHVRSHAASAVTLELALHSAPLPAGGAARARPPPPPPPAGGRGARRPAAPPPAAPAPPLTPPP